MWWGRFSETTTLPDQILGRIGEDDASLYAAEFAVAS
jgi:hypothetical protein